MGKIVKHENVTDLQELVRRLLEIRKECTDVVTYDKMMDLILEIEEQAELEVI